MILKDGNKVSKRYTYDSRWNWFRLVDDMGGVITSDSNISSAVMNSDIGSVNLLVQAATGINPFVKHFFTRLQLPSSL